MSWLPYLVRFAAAGIIMATAVSVPSRANEARPVLVAQGAPGEGCLTRREAIAAVSSGRAVPLRQVRGTAENAARGEMINAEMCMRGGQPVYVVTVLSANGKVVYVTLNAANGQLVSVR